MNETSSTTIATYNGHIKEYIDGTPQDVTGDVKLWIDATLRDMPLAASILEIGSAFGRDADYIEGLGYRVQRTDATAGFVEYLQKQGYSANHLNVITDNIPKSQDLIFADAVLLHFTPAEVELVLGKVQQALNEGGRFSFSLKRGEGEEWSDAKLGAPRYFCYWQASQILNLLESAGFDDISISDNVKWLRIIAHKPSALKEF